MSNSNPAPAEEQVIFDLSDLKKYRTELPNLYDDAELDVYEYRLLGHYKRVGICREGLPTTAKKCRMSEGQASEKRQALADKGWIKLERLEMGGKRYRYVVRVVDRWIENFARYSGMSVEEINEQVKKGSPSRGEGSPSRGEGKKELIKNQTDERFAVIAKALSEITGGGLNSESADLIGTWMEKHPDEWIFKAIQKAAAKGARHQNYVDSILIGWEANGYPKSREEKVQGAKNGDNRSSNSKSAKQSRPEKADPPAYSDADRAAAERVKKRNQQSVPTV